MKPDSDPNLPTSQPAVASGTMNDIYPEFGREPVKPSEPTAVDLSSKNPLPGPPPKKRSGGWRSAVSTILLFLLAPLIALSITAFAFQSYQVDGQSMETTLQNKDRLIVDKIPRTLSRITHKAYVPRRGDIVIFNQAGLFDTGGNQEKQLIKRVVGLPGDHVVVSNGSITIYNKANPNGFDPDKTGLYKIAAPTTSGDVDLTLPNAEIFVCGDNRGNSEDSRAFGPVGVSRIVGKLSFRILPLGKAEKF